MRIAIDIDSTLHHHWDVLSEVSMRRFGVELPYEEQLSWGTTRLRDDQFALCIEESHSDTRILSGVPYPDAVEIVCRWHAEGHVVYVVSDRGEDKRAATERWLRQIGLPFERLHCSPDKVSRCADEGVELLIDDNPNDLRRASDLGIAVAAVLHPWNEEVCEEDGLVAAGDWASLRAAVEPLLGTARTERESRGEAPSAASAAPKLGALVR